MCLSIVIPPWTTKNRGVCFAHGPCAHVLIQTISIFSLYLQHYTYAFGKPIVLKYVYIWLQHVYAYLLPIEGWIMTYNQIPYMYVV